jgi:hypothetical protein
VLDETEHLMHIHRKEIFSGRFLKLKKLLFREKKASQFQKNKICFAYRNDQAFYSFCVAVWSLFINITYKANNFRKLSYVYTF